MLGGSVRIQGDLKTRHILAKKADWRWRLSNTLRWTFLWGWFANRLAHAFSHLTGVVTITSALAIRVRRANGEWIDYGTVSYRLVTAAGVAFLVDDWDNNGQDMTTMNFHGCGTGTTAENAGDTALVTESTTVLNPNSVRATGTRSQPAANEYRTTGTLTFDGSAAITEHGLFSDADAGEGVLWDRSVFSAINVASGDSIQFQYTSTFPTGG
jgi:hypothetical protein